MNSKQVREILNHTFDVISFRQNIFTAKKSYYWGITQSGEKFADKVKELQPNATIIDFGNHFAPFHGGAKPGTAKDSYFWVKFTI